MENENGKKPVGLIKPTPAIAFFCDVAMTTEGSRIAAQVRLKHLDNNQQKKDKDTEELFKLINGVEKFVDDRLKGWVDKHPTAQWWSQIPGMPREIMGKVIGSIENFGCYYPEGDPMIPACVKRKPEIDETGARWVWVAGIERLTTPSKLWKFAGLTPDSKRQAGKKLNYNQELKTILYRLMLFGFMFNKNSYFDEYQRYKEWKKLEVVKQGIQIRPTPKGRYCATCNKEVKTKAGFYCPDCHNKLAKKEEPAGVIWEGHLDNMARRWAIKLFLCHLWVVWRTALNLPSREPYPMEKLGHTGIINPWDMVPKEEGAVEP